MARNTRQDTYAFERLYISTRSFIFVIFAPVGHLHVPGADVSHHDVFPSPRLDAGNPIPNHLFGNRNLSLVPVRGAVASEGSLTLLDQDNMPTRTSLTLTALVIYYVVNRPITMRFTGVDRLTNVLTLPNTQRQAWRSTCRLTVALLSR